MAAAEERERRIAILQQEVDSLKARLWDSAARIGDLEKCATILLNIDFSPPTPTSEASAEAGSSMPCVCSAKCHR